MKPDFYLSTKALLNVELKQALREKNNNIKAVVSIVSSKLEAMNKEAKLKGNELTESDIINLFSSELKQTKETLEGAIKSGRQEAIDSANVQIEFITRFLPRQMNEEEIKEFVIGKTGELGIVNPTKKDFGLIMKNVSSELKGRADGKLVSEIVKQLVK